MLRVDLQAILNAFRTAEGRRALLGFLIGLVGLGLGALGLFGRLANAPAVRDGLANGDPAISAGVGAMLLIMPLIVGLAVSLPAARRELFSAPYTPFLQTAPISSFRIVVRVFLRTMLTCSVFQIALGVPPLLMLVSRTDLSPGVIAALPLAGLCVGAPFVAALVFGQVLRGRFLSGPRIGAAFQVIGVVLALAMTGAFIFGIFASRNNMVKVAGAMAEGSEYLSLLFEAPLTWCVGAMLGEWSFAAISRSVATTAIVVPVLLLAARPLRAAYDRVVSATSTGIGRRIVGGARNWPTTPLRSLLRKELLGFVQERAGLVFVVFFVCAQVAVLKTRLYSVSSSTEALATVLHTNAMLMAMHGVLALFVGIHSLTIAGGEQKQFSLLATAPLSARAIVLAKIPVVVSPFVLSTLAVAIGAVPLAGAPVSAVMCFLPVAACVAVLQTGVLLAVGTRPSLLTVDPAVPLANSLRTILPALLSSGAVVATLLVTRAVGKDIRYGYRWPDEAGGAMLHYLGAVAVAAVVAVAVFAAGVWIAKRNMRIALRPAEITRGRAAGIHG